MSITIETTTQWVCDTCGKTATTHSTTGLSEWHPKWAPVIFGDGRPSLQFCSGDCYMKWRLRDNEQHPMAGERHENV